MTAYAKDQPKNGDTIMHCGHIDRDPVVRPAHWFKYDGPLKFQRPDGTFGESEWFVACESCFIQRGEQAAKRVRGDVVWTGDTPTIEKVEN